MEHPFYGFRVVKFWLPYSYTVEHIPKKRVNTRIDFAYDYVEGEIPMVSKSDTRLAASLEYVLRQPTGLSVLPWEIRTWEGSLIVKVRSDDEPEVATEWLPHTSDLSSTRPTACAPIYGFDLPRFGEVPRRFARLFAGDMRDTTHFDSLAVRGRIVSSHKDAERTRVQDIADSLVSVDGTLWRKAGYAGLFLDMRDTFGLGRWAGMMAEPHGYSFHCVFSEDERKRQPGWRRGFDVTEQERLIHHSPDEVEWNFRKLDLKDTDALSFDGEKDFIVRSMDYAVLHSADQVGDMVGEAVQAWTTVRDAVDRVRKDRANPVLDDEIDAFRILGQAVTGEHAHWIEELLIVCDEYLNDPWGRFGSRQNNNLHFGKGI